MSQKEKKKEDPKAEDDEQDQQDDENQDEGDEGDREIDPDAPIYCYCRENAWGEMVACDNKTCPYEWFHFKCVGLRNAPKGKWYCDDCRDAFEDD